MKDYGVVAVAMVMRGLPVAFQLIGSISHYLQGCIDDSMYKSALCTEGLFVSRLILGN